MLLRPYQNASAEDIRNALRQGHSRVCLQSPTGSGKTVLFSYITHGASTKGKTVTILAHRSEILDQISRALTESGTPHGMIQSGKSGNFMLPVQVASVQTLVHRLDSIPEPDMLIIDECHHTPSATYTKILATWKKAKVLGVTATPCRTDGKGLKDYYDILINGPQVQWLIDEGYLARPIYYAPRNPVDVSSLHKQAGDYVKSEAAELMDKPTITGDLISHYRKYADGLRAVAFCVNLKHAENVAAAFKVAGIPSISIDGKLSPQERKARLDALRSGSVKMLTSCDLIGEGLDIPAIDCAVLARPTMSKGLHFQQVGRALRMTTGKVHAIILDHVGNTLRHGLVETPTEWTLEGRVKRRGQADDEPAVKIKTCPECYAIYGGGSICPQCGVESVKEREIAVVEGELVRLTDAQRYDMERERKREEAACGSYEDWAALGKKRGNKPGWAYFRWNTSWKNKHKREEAEV